MLFYVRNALNHYFFTIIPVSCHIALVGVQQVQAWLGYLLSVRPRTPMHITIIGRRWEIYQCSRHDG